MDNCQAEVQSKSSPTPKSKVQLQSPNSNSRLDWRDTKIELPTHPPTHPTHPTPPATSWALPEVLLPSVIHFWKPLMTPDSDPTSNDVLDSCQERPCHPRLQPGELNEIYSDFKNFKAYHYLDDLRNHPDATIMFLTPVRNVCVIQDSNLENLLNSTPISKIPKPFTI